MFYKFLNWAPQCQAMHVDKRGTPKMMLLFVSAMGLFLSGQLPLADKGGIFFRFKNKTYTLTAGMRPGALAFYQRGGVSPALLDTLSNWFDPEKNYVEIVRQDDPAHPGAGMALGFEFDEKNGEYPYTPAQAVLQLKNFEWGGVEFSACDTLNYTGVSNAVSDDVQIEIDGFVHDTIFGRFSGLLVSGAGQMTPIEEGRFRVKLYRR